MATLAGTESTETAALPRAASTLVIQTAFLGDVILTTGLLTALAKRYGPVDLVVTPDAVPLVETHPAVRRVLAYDKRGRDRGIAGFRRMAGWLRHQRYARAVVPHRSFRSALLARWAGIPSRIGFADAAAPWLYTETVTRPEDGHEAERLLALAKPAPGARAEIHIELTEEDRAIAYAWLAERNIGDGFVAVAPGSVWGSKRWPGYPELAKLLPGRVVVVGGPADRDVAMAVASSAPDRVANAAGGLSLRASAAVLERAAVLVTNDSAPLHMASAVGTPTVALFGPTVPAFGFGPRAPEAAIVERGDLGCRPCSSHGPARCPLGHHRCLREISAASVRDVIRTLLA